MEKKYIKTSENPDLNDFLQETQAWINFHPAIINSQQQRIVSVSKNMLFSRELLHR